MNINSACRVLAAFAFTFGGMSLLAQTDAVAPPPDATTASPMAAAMPSPANTPHTGVRIVRLSQVKGEVQLDRDLNGDQASGFENAFANIPITQGAKLRTEAGVAEVEFEDNSTLRLTPDTTIEFTELRRDPSGITASSVKVLQGTLFVSLAPTTGNQFTVMSAQGKLTLAPSARIHFHVGAPQTSLAVLDGSVEAQVGSSNTTVVRKTTLLFDPASQAPPTLVKHLEKTSYDDWDKTEVSYHQRYMNTASFGNSFAGNSLYGVSDMNYYGNFSDAGGCGSMWRPYLASAAWDPYGSGTLAYYPSAGYSWVSPYPWGWTAYNSGSWINCPGTGWGWQPGAGYSGLSNLNAVTIKKHGIIIPPSPPKTGRGLLLSVNRQPIHASGFADRSTFVFNKDSAGLGVPRETFGKLNKVSTGAQQHGSVTTAAYSAPVSFASSAGTRTVSFAHAGTSPSMGFSSRSAGGFTGGSAGTAASLPSSLSSSSAGISHAGGSSGGGGAHH